MIRLRQVALVAHDLELTTDFLRHLLGVEVCFQDPGVAEFGLHNNLLLIGDQFLEIVAPVQPNTTAGRLLDKRHVDCTGYMAIYEVDDLDRREAHLREHGVRVVWSLDLPDIRGRHLHPRDVGGALVSVDQPVPSGSWRWAGPTWPPLAHHHTSVVTGIAGVRVGADDPEEMRTRWHELELDHMVSFHPAGEHGEGIDALDLVVADRARAGEVHRCEDFEIRFV
ncbi:MAG: VOC family protein [Acidimicrobiales bacterium]|nr:VOC family protein [Acidimicrobiales bacterium]MCB9395261.1 VOC family protein [Acidimicrobiaceae bacterium]